MRVLVASLLLGVFLGVAGDAPTLPAPYTEHCIVGEKNLYPPPPENQLPKATVNMDLPPEYRWAELTGKYKHEIADLVGVIKNISYSFFQGKLVQWIDKHMDNWDNLFPSPYREELKGIATATGVPLGELVLYNVFYEISSVCTAILGQDNTGKLFHARNMDFGLFMGWNYKTHDWEVSEAIRKLQIQVTFTKNGQYLYEGIVFPGFVGQFSAMKKGLFSLTLNERYSLQSGWIGLLKWLMGNQYIKFTTYVAREVLETSNSFDEAKQVLSTANITSPIYYLLGGNKTNQGVLITRGLTKTLGSQDLATAPQGWYILQTNYDPWASPLYLDDRRAPGNKCMQRLGQENFNFQGIYNVLSSQTNFNLLTVYTHLMQVNDGRMETYVQKCPQPCWPF